MTSGGRGVAWRKCPVGVGVSVRHWFAPAPGQGDRPAALGHRRVLLEPLNRGSCSLRGPPPPSAPRWLRWCTAATGNLHGHRLRPKRLLAPTQGSVDFKDTSSNATSATARLPAAVAQLDLDPHHRRSRLQCHRGGRHHCHVYARHGFRGSAARRPRRSPPGPLPSLRGIARRFYDGAPAPPPRRRLSPAAWSPAIRPSSATPSTPGTQARQALTAAGSVSDGNDGDNYAVTFASTTGGVINPQPVTVTAGSNTKVYDGTTSAGRPRRRSLPAAWPPGDTAVFSETYDTPAVGTGKTLIPSGSVNDGNNGNNYQVTMVTNTAGDISPRRSTISLVTVSPTSVTAGVGLAVVVTAEDVGGNVVSNYGGTVSFTSSDPREPDPAGSVTFTAGSAVAYALATLQTAGPGPSRPATATIAGASAPSPVTAAAACGGRLLPAARRHVRRHDVQPGEGRSGRPLWKHHLHRRGSTANVTLTIASGSGGQVGTTTVAAVAGLATFSNVSIDQTGSYTLTASAAGLSGTATSDPFAVAPGAGRATGVHQPARPHLHQRGRHGDGDDFHRQGRRRGRLRQHGDHGHLQRDACLERGRQRRRRGTVQRQRPPARSPPAPWAAWPPSAACRSSTPPPPATATPAPATA